MRLDRNLDLITQMVQALYDAENQLVLALPRVAARAGNPALRQGLEKHLPETVEHSRRLERIAAGLGVPCAGRKCLAMEGLLKEGEDAMGFGGSQTLVDAALIASCQGVEHFEISQYRALAELCRAGDVREATELLELTLAEEEEASKQLAKLGAASLKEERVRGR